MNRAAILWWGSYPYGQVTVGDYMSVVALSDELERRGIPFDIIQRETLPPAPLIAEFGSANSTFNNIDPTAYKAVAFVCGPLPTAWPEGRSRILDFSRARRIAVGASLTSDAARAAALATFDDFFCRDGFGQKWMDLSLACDWPLFSAQREGIATCWRGFESIYGAQCANGPIEAIAASALALRQLRSVALSTDVQELSTPIRAIDAQFAAYHVIITTRLHGALLSLRNRTPFVAIDQQVGGGKVASTLGFAGWPLLASVEDLSLSVFHRLLDAAEHGWTAEQEEIRERSVELARATLRAAADAIEFALAS